MSTPSATNAAPTPTATERQPRVIPTASTIVRASTISTAEARNAPSTTRTCGVTAPTGRAARPPSCWMAAGGRERAPRRRRVSPRLLGDDADGPVGLEDGGPHPCRAGEPAAAQRGVEIESGETHPPQVVVEDAP